MLPMIAGTPLPTEPVPAPIRHLAAGRAVRPVWRNELGGVTYQLGEGPDRLFAKWSPAGSGIEPAREAARLRWAGRYLATVPQVLDHGADPDGRWLLTAGLPGENAVSARWKADPRAAVTAIGHGLRRLHDTLPVADCPYSWSAAGRLTVVRQRHRDGVLDPAEWNRDHAGISVAMALDRLADTPPVDRLAVCHGDACAPNTLLDDAGEWAGHVDLGLLGVADRWADLALATWSLGWNYGPGWEEVLLAAYGIDPDPERIRYYRLLSDLMP
jgi:kanamycin kinase